MPLHDQKCPRCKYEFEAIVQWDEYEKPCPMCKAMAKRQYKSFKGIQHDAPDYLSDVLQVVDKESGAKHCTDFLDHPNRKNYNNWMKGEGIRPMDRGEGIKKVTKSEKVLARKKKLDGIQRKFKEREAISI